ncbi:MAG: glycosyltransferase family 4 protein [Chloroflexi bacterium]|nr:glycosyltransferase family 4 protein [Chloroflexota bacterium]
MREIAFVHGSAQMSGVEFSTLYLVQHIDRTRWSPLVICPEEGDLPARCRSAGAPTAIVASPRLFSTSVRIAGATFVNPAALLADLGSILATVHPLSRELRRRRPALVVTKGLLAHLYGGLAARWAGVPCVWHVQDRVSNRAGPLFPWTLSLVGRILANQAIADAESIAQQLSTFVPRERISVVWNGVDTREFSPCVDGAAVRAEWGAGTGDLLVGVVGRLTAWKGQHVLLHAFSRIASRYPQARLVIVGSTLFDTDQYARSLHSDASRLGLGDRVIFAGFRTDFAQVLAALDILVHPALDKDSSPLAVVSGMAAGKPIICSRVDGTAQLFDDGVDGVLFAPGDAHELADQLARVLGDAELRLKLGRGARDKAERYLSIERFVEQCQTVFERAIDDAPASLRS